MQLDQILDGVVPVLRVNNRRMNIDFYTQTLGFTLLLEDAGFTNLGDLTKKEKIVLEETPGNRVRKVQGPKKVAEIILKASVEEIEALLASGATYTNIYKGAKGLAFRAVSPEGDRFLLHGEEDVDSLLEIERLDLETVEGPVKLSSIEVEKVILHHPQADQAQVFYQSLGLGKAVTVRQEEGQDLLLANDQTWDISSLYVRLRDLPLADLEAHFADADFFVPKRKQYLLVNDHSQVAVLFENV